jgi:hypothetical protein
MLSAPLAGAAEFQWQRLGMNVGVGGGFWLDICPGEESGVREGLEGGIVPFVPPPAGA